MGIAQNGMVALALYRGDGSINRNTLRCNTWLFS